LEDHKQPVSGQPTSPWTLPANDVHLWQARLDREVREEQGLLESLSKDERARAKGFRFERDRRRFIVARGLLRMLLGRYLGMSPANLRFGYGPHGKPYLKAIGAGFSLAPSQFEVSMAPVDPALLKSYPEPNEDGLWSLKDVDIGADYAAALAVEGGDWQIMVRGEMVLPPRQM